MICVWMDIINNFFISLMELLDAKQLVDVTLVADGHMFSAHRLIEKCSLKCWLINRMHANSHFWAFSKDDNWDHEQIKYFIIV